jgi:hypothetical protein
MTFDIFLFFVVIPFLGAILIMGLLFDIRIGKYTKRKYAHLYWILDSGLKINFLNRHRFKFNNQGRYLFEYSLYSKFVFKRMNSEYQFIPFFLIDAREHMIFSLDLSEYQDTIEDLFKKNLFSENEFLDLQNIGLQEEITINYYPN